MPRRLLAAAAAAALLTAACSGGSAATTTTTDSAGTILPAVPAPTDTAAPDSSGNGCPALADDRGGLTPFSNVELAAHTVDGTELWALRLGAAFVREFAVVDGVVYASLKAGPLVALDARTCAELWRVDPPVAAMGFVIADGVLYGANEFDVAAYELSDGSQIWRGLGAVLAGTVLAADEIVVSPAAVGVLLAGDPTLLGYQSTDGSPRFAVPLGDGSAMPAGIASDEATFYLARQSSVEARNSADGELRWTTPLGFAPAFAPVLADDTLVAAGRGHVAALSRSTGEVLWSTAVDIELAGQPLLAGRVLSVLGVDGTVHTADLTAGTFERVAAFPACCTFAMPEESMILVQQGGISTAYGITGEELWSVRTGANGRDRFTRAAVDDGLVVTVTWSPRGAR